MTLIVSVQNENNNSRRAICKGWRQFSAHVKDVNNVWQCVRIVFDYIARWHQWKLHKHDGTKCTTRGKTRSHQNGWGTVETFIDAISFYRWHTTSANYRNQEPKKKQIFNQNENCEPKPRSCQCSYKLCYYRNYNRVVLAIAVAFLFNNTVAFIIIFVDGSHENSPGFFSAPSARSNWHLTSTF